MNRQSQEYKGELFYRYERQFVMQDATLPACSRVDRLQRRRQKTRPLLRCLSGGIVTVLTALVVWCWPMNLTADSVQDKAAAQKANYQRLQPPADVRMNQLIRSVGGYGQDKKNIAQFHPAGEKIIVVNLPSRTLELYTDNRRISQYPVAVGKPSTPTPVGNYTVIQKEVNPTWYPPRRKMIVPSGPSNPLGYRWMGFAADYGIHGTNAPAYIGDAVSNGCIRLAEPNVEAVYEQVTDGTPVKITYDVVKMTIDQKGQALLGIYPDIYGYSRTIALPDVRQKLAEYGLERMLGDDALRQIIAAAAGQEIPIARFSALKVNGRLLPGWEAVSAAGNVFIPVRPVAAVIQADLVWDEQNDIVEYEGKKVRGIVQNDILYITAVDVQNLFGGLKLWWAQDNCWEFLLPELVNSSS